jgi:hypothetical protein
MLAKFRSCEKGEAALTQGAIYTSATPTAPESQS